MERPASPSDGLEAAKLSAAIKLIEGLPIADGESEEMLLSRFALFEKALRWIDELHTGIASKRK